MTLEGEEGERRGGAHQEGPLQMHSKEEEGQADTKPDNEKKPLLSILFDTFHLKTIVNCRQVLREKHGSVLEIMTDRSTDKPTIQPTNRPTNQPTMDGHEESWGNLFWHF